jgi:hypothetical protein
MGISPTIKLPKKGLCGMEIAISNITTVYADFEICVTVTYNQMFGPQGGVFFSSRGPQTVFMASMARM